MFGDINGAPTTQSTRATTGGTQKASLAVEVARKAARNLRELNNFIAHEVRNPLSAALSACSFVTTAVAEEMQPLMEECQSNKNLDAPLDGCHIFSSSLQGLGVSNVNGIAANDSYVCIRMWDSMTS